MSNPVVLITGGTSRTGSGLAQLLLATGSYTVRIAARNPSKLAAFVAQGADAVELNSTLTAMQTALKGANSVFFIYPALTGGVGDTLFANLMEALKGNGTTLKQIVYLSTMRASPNDEKFELAYKHHLNEQQVIRSGIPYTIIRPTYFHENIVTNFADSIRRTGEYRTSSGDGVWTTIAIADVVEVALAAIVHPEEHSGKVYSLREEAVTHDQVAEKISKVIGGSVKHVKITPEEHYELVKKYYTGPDPVEAIAHHAVRADKEKRDGEYSVVTSDLEMVLGRKGITLDDYLAEHADAFKEQ